jgi:predicted ribosome quality control (RQC) complex YloA/Tae2 family protein
MLSLAELRRAVRLADALAGARVERVVQPDPLRVVLSLHGREAGEAHLLLSADPPTGRLSRLAERRAAPPKPPAFAQLLRARLGAARFAGARILGGDRQAALRFEGAEGVHELLLSLLGPRSNVYLLDAEERVIGALRPLAETRRDLALGQAWRSPASAPPPAGEDRFAAEPDEGFFAALEAAARAREERDEGESLRRRVERALRRGAQSLEKKIGLLRGDLAAGEETAALRRQGELLKGALARVRPGDRSVRARDFETGEEVEVALDPALAARANLEALFARARKAERRAARALREQGDAAARREELAALERDFAALAADASALERFAARPEVARLLARFAPERAAQAAGGAPAPGGAAPRRRVFRLGREEVPARLAPRVYRASGGLEIWVGRSDEGNDLLSTRLARGNDLFFHLDASPGSHVVLRTEGRADPPSESVLEACELAVHFSRHRKVTEAHVLVASIKNVRKPKGAKPGLVFVSGGRSVRLRRDPERLERVLASREAE